MKRLIKVIGYLVFTFIATIALLPKVDLYYKIERILKKEHIILSDEIPVDKMFSLNLKNITLYYNDIAIGNISNFNLLPFIFYNSLTIEDVKLDEALKVFFPEKINKIVVTYLMTDPINLHLTSKGKFGEVKGVFNLKTKRIHIVLIPTKYMKKNYANTLKLMKSKNGQYIYDKTL